MHTRAVPLKRLQVLIAKAAGLVGTMCCCLLFPNTEEEEQPRPTLEEHLLSMVSNWIDSAKGRWPYAGQKH